MKVDVSEPSKSTDSSQERCRRVQAEWSGVSGDECQG